MSTNQAMCAEHPPRVPSALLPSQFVFLEQLPRLANGELARLDIPAGGPESTRRFPPVERDAPVGNGSR